VAWSVIISVLVLVGGQINLQVFMLIVGQGDQIASGVEVSVR
jgi:hypothetical protein